MDHAVTALAHFALAVALSGAGVCAARLLARGGGHCIGAAAGLAAFFGVAIPLQIPRYYDVSDGYFARYALPMAGVTACVVLLAALALSKPKRRTLFLWLAAAASIPLASSMLLLVYFSPLPAVFGLIPAVVFICEAHCKRRTLRQSSGPPQSDNDAPFFGW